MTAGRGGSGGLPGWLTLRRVRLVSGLVLFTYVTLHLLDHSLLNVSIDTAEAMLRVMKTVWQGMPGAVVLYAALAVHLGLAFWALYERRHFQWRASEAVQLVLGFAIPLLLANHLIATRVSLSLFHTEKGYPIELWSFWVSGLAFGAVQHVLVLAAWLHGCVGVWLWLRLKPWAPRVAPVLLGLAVLLPALALLGSFQGGRAVRERARDPAWVAANLPLEDIGSAEQNRRLANMRSGVWAFFGAGVLLVLGGRGVRSLRERRRGLVRISYVDGRTVRVPKGLTVLEASRLYRVPHTSVCGGRGRCTTCRVRVFDDRGELPAPSAAEAAALERVRAEPMVRLGCQLRPVADLRLSLMVPAEKARQRALRGGEERHLVIMFVDMRGSTALAERRLPFDTVFVVNSFLAAVGRAVSDAGGVANQVLGDGLLGLFGLGVDGRTAARQAMAAARRIAANVAALNRQLATDLQAPLGYGIGVNAGDVIVGDVGYEEFRVFTALGDPVNVAARLEALTKEYAAALLVTEAVWAEAGETDGPGWARHVVQARGREAVLVVRAATAETLEGEAAGGSAAEVPARGDAG